jgi:hypothetical protein
VSSDKLATYPPPLNQVREAEHHHPTSNGPPWLDGSTAGPFSKVEGLFTVLMCADCQAARGHGSRPYPVMTSAEMRASLDLLPTWALQQKAAANRQVIAIMRGRLAAGQDVVRMYQEPGLAWLERQAEVAEELIAQRKRTAEHRPGS